MQQSSLPVQLCVINMPSFQSILNLGEGCCSFSIASFRCQRVCLSILSSSSVFLKQFLVIHFCVYWDLNTGAVEEQQCSYLLSHLYSPSHLTLLMPHSIVSNFTPFTHCQYIVLNPCHKIEAQVSYIILFLSQV